MSQKKGATKAEVVSRLVEHADMKDAAAQLTQVADDMLYNVLKLHGSNAYGFSKPQNGHESFQWSHSGRTYENTCRNLFTSDESISKFVFIISYL